MQLVTFGKVHLTGCGFSRPKPLLLLSYLTLEGPQKRRKLAELFWEDNKKGDKKALQKKLGKLSVVLAQFKKEGAAEAFPSKPGLDPISSQVACDALAYLDALDKGNLEEALELYQGPFLYDLGKALVELGVSDEVEDWVLETRENFAQEAQGAMIGLAERAFGAGDVKTAKVWAEKAYQLSEAPEIEPAVLSRLNKLLTVSESDLADASDSDVATNLDELSNEALRVFLALALQDEPNLTIARAALNLPISTVSEAREELILNGLTDANGKVLAKDMARHWLSERPTERMPLLLALARATPPEGAFKLYQAVYQSTQGFGGVGDVPRARAAYCTKAKSLMEDLNFAKVAELMSELREVEKVTEAEPEADARFLEAYALERIGRFKEAFERIQGLPEAAHTPDITALKAVLLWRLGKHDEARACAEVVLKSGLDWLWARATATNTLGALALSSGDFLESASQFNKAASLFNAAGDKNRWAGSLNNHAIALDMLSATTKDNNQKKILQTDAEKAYQNVLDALDQIDEQALLRARVLLNLGLLWEHRKAWDKAEAYYLEATPFAERAAALEISARLSVNLGNIYVEQKRFDEAKTSFGRAIETAAEAGEFAIQGQAIANRAILESNADSMEVALELLEQSGQLFGSDEFLADYEVLLQKMIEHTQAQGDSKKVQRFKKKLMSLKKKEAQEPGLEGASTLPF